jgi:hypothetical protein
MMGNTTPRGYVVTIRAWTRKGDDKTASEAQVEVAAYDALEAMMCADLKFRHTMGGSVLQGTGGETAIVNVEPSAHLAAADVLAAMFKKG